MKHDFLRWGSDLGAAGLMLLMCVLLGMAGCRSTTPTGAKAAAFNIIEGHSLTQIRLAAIDVFRASGYTVASAYGRNLVFERRMTTMTDIAFGAWLDTTVWLRVKLRIEELNPDVNILECNIYRIVDHDNKAMEEEKEAYEMSHRPFKELLAKIKAKVESAPKPADSPVPPPMAPRS